jgi:hypothetical protein
VIPVMHAAINSAAITALTPSQDRPANQFASAQQIVAFGAKTWLPQIAVISGINWARDSTSVIIPTSAAGKIAPVAL